VDHTTPAERRYVLGNHPEELARLDRQAATIDAATRVLLRAAGLAPGMRVLDLGTGLGHVAGIVAELVGPTGHVVGVDRSPDALAVARERAQALGLTNVGFEEGDATSWRAESPFDVIVERLLLFHAADPAAVVRHHVAANLRPAGTFVAIDFDIGASRAEPFVPLVDAALQWVQRAFRAAGAWPRIGAMLGTILDAAGLADVRTFGVQEYLQPHDPAGPGLLAGVVRSLSPAILQHGIATPEELDLPTLDQRIAGAVRDAGAVILPPTVAGAWGRRP
jgi:ubiquinone/menaquinone biosynthesis C-methylase UbiE